MNPQFFKSLAEETGLSLYKSAFGPQTLTIDVYTSDERSAYSFAVVVEEDSRIDYHEQFKIEIVTQAPNADETNAALRELKEL